MDKYFKLWPLFVILVSCTHKSEPESGTKPVTVTATEINKCIVDACGPAGVLPNAYGVNFRPGIPLGPMRIWVNEFEPLLLKYVEAERQNDIFLNYRLKEALQKNLHFEKGNPGQIILAVLKLYNIIEVNASAIIDYSDLTAVQIRQNELSKVLADHSPAEQAAVRMLINEVTLPAIQQAIPLAQDPLLNPLTVRLKALFPNETLHNAEIRDAQAVVNTGKRLLATAGPLLGNFIAGDTKNPVVLKAVEGMDLERVEAERYLEIAVKTGIFAKILDGGPNQKILAAVDVDLGLEVEKYKESGALQRRIKEAESRSSDERVKNISDVCTRMVQASATLNTSGLRRQKALGMIAATKDAAYTVAKKYFDPQRQDWLKKKIADLEFAMPDTVENMYARLHLAFDQVGDSVERNKILRESQTEETSQLLVISALADETFNFDSKEDRAKTAKYGDEKDLVAACERLPISTTSDFSLSSLGKISLSWFSVNYPEFGPSIVAHEIGHALSKAARILQNNEPGANKEFSKSLTCVGNRNPGLSSSVALEKDLNTRWSEEDWADHFSAQVMEVLASENNTWASKENMGCALVNEDDKSYSESALIDPGSDSHSSGILRLLLTGNDRANLPASCRAILKTQAAGRKLNCN